MILTPAEIKIWVAMAALTMATDLVMGYRRFSGKLGCNVRAAYMDTARRFGGVWVLMSLALLLDTVLWPFGLIGASHAYIRDYRTYQAELQAEARARAVQS